MNYKVKGFISSISEIETLDNGAKKMSYRVNTEEQYNNIWEFELYKSADHVTHIDNFTKYNKVGDRVEVEFQVRPREYKDKVYTSLSHWKIEKLTDEENVIQGEANQTFVAEGDDGLPF